MSTYKTMYLISQREYNNLASDGAGLNYHRQVNNFDVNDGGRVVIRNDDKIVNKQLRR